MLHFAWASPVIVSQLSEVMVEFLVDILIWGKRIKVVR